MIAIHAKYVGVVIILLTIYLFTIWCEPIHKLCLMGGAINIIINLSNINPVKRKIMLKSEVENNENENNEPSYLIQFGNLCKGFRFGAIGYILTLGVVPYSFYRLINPEKNVEMFKSDMITLFKKTMDQTKTK